jgi:hypothetical protein
VKWLKNILKIKTAGAWVEVSLDYGFGRIQSAAYGDNPFAHCLHISDLKPEVAQKALRGKRFDWHQINSQWRHNLEINGLHSATWDEVQQYLREP